MDVFFFISGKKKNGEKVEPAEFTVGSWMKNKDTIISNYENNIEEININSISISIINCS